MTRTITSRPRMAATYAPGSVRCPPLARRRRRARLPPALGLVGPRRPHRHSSHHGPSLTACRVVAHRDEGMTAISTAPRPFRPGRGETQIRARQWPRPVFNARSKTRCPSWQSCGMMKLKAASR